MQLRDGRDPVCKTCTPRATSVCAHCGLDRPPAARWPEGAVCDPCYTGALRRRGTCAACGQERRLIAPPGPGAIICADCAGLPLTHLCALCGVEDKLFEKGRCARCSLRGRASDLLPGPGAEPIAGLTGLIEAITAARNPYSALNWLRTGAAAVILAEVATGRTASPTRRSTSTRTSAPRTICGTCWPPAERCPPGTRPWPASNGAAARCSTPSASPPTGAWSRPT